MLPVTRALYAALVWALCGVAQAQAQTPAATSLPIFDAHIHYSHDAWEVVPTAQVIDLMRKAGLRRALVSSSNDEGTRRLYDAAPDLVVPSLRPYRSRGEISTWARDPSIVTHLEARLARYRYAAIGEFHLYGADTDLPVPTRMIELARQHGLILHAHSDADAIDRIFRQWPQARVIWAHSGFDRPASVREVLRRHPTLMADLAFRSDMATGSAASGSKVDPEWQTLFLEMPERFMVGTDTFTPERLHFIGPHADFSRTWLAGLPPEVRQQIAWGNAERFIGPVWAASRDRPFAAAPAAPVTATATGTATGTAASGAASRTATQNDSRPCPTDAAATRVEGRQVALFYRTAPAIGVGTPFRMTVELCPTDAAAAGALRVDAVMPDHRHGMNYAPSVMRDATGRYTVDGMLLHMGGRWQILFDVLVAGRSERLTHELVLR
jgi:hypothetical protein